MTLQGIDVSAYQPVGDWTKVPGISFSVARASLGSSYVDPTYHGHVTGAVSAGLIPGAYHFLYPGGAVAQCDHFLAVIGNPAGLLIQLDCEQAGLQHADVTEFVHRWNERTNGYPIFIYAGRPLWIRFGNPDMKSLGPWWLPDYPGGSGYPGDGHPAWSLIAGGQRPTVWQWGPAHLGGFPHSVDGDAFRGTRAQLQAFAPGGTTPNQPVEDPVIYQDGPVQTAIKATNSPWFTEPNCQPLTSPVGDGRRYVVLGYSADRKFAECSGYVSVSGKFTECLWTATSSLSAFQPLATDCSAAVAAATAPLNAKIAAGLAALK